MTDSTPPSTRAIPDSLPREPAVGPSTRSAGAIGDDACTTAAYKPLSLLAVAGIALAIPYALFVLVGGLTALYTGSPFLLSGITVIVPLAAAILSLAALVRINRSEGVLGGGRLATWGLRISLLFGLGYWAYFTATVLAVRQQADEVGRNWLQKIVNGRINSAFLMVIDPKNKPPHEDPSNPDDDALRKQLETRFDSGNQSDPRGLLSQFPQHDLVRLLRLMGKDVKIEFVGSTDFEYKDGYTVGLRYRLTGPEGAVNVKMVLQGVDNEEDPGSGRRWFIRLEQTSLDGRPEFTSVGEHKLVVCRTAKLFLQEWLKTLGEGHFDRAFLDTLDAKNYDQGKASLIEVFVPLLASVPLSPSSPSATIASGYANYVVHKDWEKQNLVGFPAFAEGRLVRPDPKGFWAQDDDFRQMILKDVKARFKRPDEDLLPHLKVDQNSFPHLTEEEGKYVLELDATFRLMSKQIMVDVVFVVECEKDVGENGNLYVYKLNSFDLRRAKKVDLASSGTLRKIPLTPPSGQAPEAPGAPPP